MRAAFDVQTLWKGNNLLVNLKKTDLYEPWKIIISGKRIHFKNHA